MLARKFDPMTAEAFLHKFEGREGKWELLDGEPRLMAGGSIAHARVGSNIGGTLLAKLRGSGCRPMNSDTGLRVSDTDVLYPDVAIYCDQRDLGLNGLETKTYEHPKVVFEVLSPSTARYDRLAKMRKYEGIASLRLVVIVDPARETLETYERVEGEPWRVNLLPTGAPLELTDPAVTLTAEEIFAV